MKKKNMVWDLINLPHQCEVMKHPYDVSMKEKMDDMLFLKLDKESMCRTY